MITIVTLIVIVTVIVTLVDIVIVIVTVIVTTSYTNSDNDSNRYTDNYIDSNSDSNGYSDSNIYTIGRKDIFYLTTHSTHFILRLYGVGHMVKDHSHSERGNPLSPHGLLFPINSKGSFICTIPQTR